MSYAVRRHTGKTEISDKLNKQFLFQETNLIAEKCNRIEKQTRKN